MSDLETDYITADVSMETSVDTDTKWVERRYEPHTRFLFERARLMKSILGDDVPAMDFVENADGSTTLKIEQTDGNMVEYIVNMFSIVTTESLGQTDLETYVEHFMDQISKILNILGQACDMIYDIAKDKKIIQLAAKAENVVYTIVESADYGEVDTNLDIQLVDFDFMYQFGNPTRFISDLLENTTGSKASLDEMAKIVALLFHRSVRNVAVEQYNDFLQKHSFDRVLYPIALPPIPVSFSDDPLAEEAAYGIETLRAKIDERFNVDMSTSSDSSKMVKGFKLRMGLNDITGRMTVARRADLFDKWPEEKSFFSLDDITAFFTEENVKFETEDVVLFLEYARTISIVDDVVSELEDLAKKDPPKDVIRAVARSLVVDRIQTTELDGMSKRVTVAKIMDVTPQYLSELEQGLSSARNDYLYVIPEEYDIIGNRVLDALETTDSNPVEVNPTISIVEMKYTSRVIETARKTAELFILVDQAIFVEEFNLNDRVRLVEDFIRTRREQLAELLAEVEVDESQYMSYIAREALALASTIKKTRTVVNSEMVNKVTKWMKEYGETDQDIHNLMVRLVDAFDHGLKTGLMVGQVLQEWYRVEISNGNHKTLFKLRMLWGPSLTNNNSSNGPTWDMILSDEVAEDVRKNVIAAVSSYDPQTATRLRLTPVSNSSRLENLRKTYAMESHAEHRKNFTNSIMDEMENVMKSTSPSDPKSLSERFASSPLFGIRIPYLIEWLSAAGPAPPKVRGGIIDTSMKVDHGVLKGLRHVLTPLEGLSGADDNLGFMMASLILNQFRKTSGGLAYRLEFVKMAILGRKYLSLLPDEQAQIDEAVGLFNTENGTDYEDFEDALFSIRESKNEVLHVAFKSKVLDLFKDINGRFLKTVGLWGISEEIDHMIDWKKADARRRWPEQAPLSESLSKDQAIVWMQFLIRAPNVQAPDGCKPFVDIMTWARDLGEKVTPPRSAILETLDEGAVPEKYGFSVLIGDEEDKPLDDNIVDKISDSIYYDEKTKVEDKVSGRVTLNDQRSDPSKVVILSRVTLIGPASKLPLQYLQGEGVQFYAKPRKSSETILIGGTGKYKPSGPSAIEFPEMLTSEYTIYIVPGGQPVRAPRPRTKTTEAPVSTSENSPASTKSEAAPVDKPELPPASKPEPLANQPSSSKNETPNVPPAIDLTAKPTAAPDIDLTKKPKKAPASKSKVVPTKLENTLITDEVLRLPTDKFYDFISKNIRIVEDKRDGLPLSHYLITYYRDYINKLRIVVRSVVAVYLSTKNGDPPVSALARIVSLVEQATDDIASGTKSADELKFLKSVVSLRQDIIHRYSSMPETASDMRELVTAWDSLDLTKKYNKQLFDDMMTELCKKKERTRENMASILKGIAEKNGMNSIKSYF